MKTKVSKFELQTATAAILASLVIVIVGMFACFGVIWKERYTEQFAQMRNISYTIAADGSYADNLKEGVLSAGNTARLGEIASGIEFFDHISVFDTRLNCLYSSSGAPDGYAHDDAVLTALRESGTCDDSYTMEDGTKMLVTYRALTDSNGTVQGYVGIDVSYASFMDSLRSSSQILLICGAVVFLIVDVAMLVYMKNIRKHLFGLDPDQMEELVLVKAEALNTIAEMLLFSDKDGKVTMCNQVTFKLYNRPYEDNPKFTLRDIDGSGRLYELSQKRAAFHNMPLTVSGHQLLLSGRPVIRSGEYSGFMFVGRDMTEFVQIHDKLTGANSLIETLRTVNHDFKNKMHIVLGFLETEHYEDAKRYISDFNAVSTSGIESITSQVQNPVLGALLVGKMLRASELKIRLVLMPNSTCSVLTEGVDVSQYATIIGNLVDNAIEAMNGLHKSGKQIEVSIVTNADYSIIGVSDNGPGMTENIRSHALELGFTSKEGGNRGIGLATIKKIAESHHGTVEIDSEPDEGTVITVTFSRGQNA